MNSTASVPDPESSDNGRESPIPLISIITVCLNEVNAIDRTLESMLQQDRRQVEWIVFDGGSTDGTLAKLQAHQTEIAILHSAADGGIYPAMNQAARRATGKYLFFLNGGDTFLAPDVLAAFSASHPQADLITGDVEVVYPDGTAQYRPAIEIENLSDRLYWRSLPHIATFIRRDRFIALNGYDTSYRICADWDLFLRANRAGADFLRWPHPVGRFYFDGLSASPAATRHIQNEKIRLRRQYPLSYRLRRDLNEWIGRQQQALRDRRNPSPPPGTECL